MNSKPLAFKIAALSFSVMLAGSYIWYRAGGDLPFISTAAAESPEAPPQEAPSADEESIEVPPEVLAQIEEQDRQMAKSADEARMRRIILSGSKSDPVFTSRSEPRREAQPAQESLEPATLGDHFPGSKSERINFDRPKVKPTAKQQSSANVERRTFMFSSKDPILNFEDNAEPTPKPAPKPVEPKPEAQSAAPQRARTVLPGSKSAAVVVERNRERTDETPEAVQREQQRTPPKRTILPGSKSAMVIEREPKPQAAPESSQQQRQQAAPKRVILPGSKSSEVDVSTVRPTPKPQPTPEETKRIEEEVRKRTILPGSKSMRIDVDRIRERTPAPKREPEPKPETGPADKPGATNTRKLRGDKSFVDTYAEGETPSAAVRVATIASKAKTEQLSTDEMVRIVRPKLMGSSKSGALDFGELHDFINEKVPRFKPEIPDTEFLITDFWNEKMEQFAREQSGRGTTTNDEPKTTNHW